jgi:lysophospholipase L1-like esterase
MRSLRLGAAVVVFLLGACSSPANSAPSGSERASAAPSASESTSPGASSVSASPEAGLLLVAIGDSIPFNSPEDCPGCTGFVNRYGAALSEASGTPVKVLNDSEHNNNTVDMLSQEVADSPKLRTDLAAADAIIVGIAHNDAPMNRDDDSCDGAGGENPDWSKFTDACIATEVARFTPKYQGVYETVATLRGTKPTILRTINRYNDWNGWPDHDLSAAGVAATVKIIKAWNEMICGAAKSNGFICADISTRFNGTDGKTPSGDLLAKDYTHPSEKGNEAIAKVLIDLGFAPLVP